MTDTELTDLIAASQENNKRIGVTGMLLYKGGNFMQVIEGNKQTVTDLYAKIRHDARHRGVLTLLQEEIVERPFPEWAMSLKNVDRIDAHLKANLSTFLSDDFVAESYRTNPTAAIKLLLMFRDNMR